MEKSNYEECVIEIIYFDGTDVITESDPFEGEWT